MAASPPDYTLQERLPLTRPDQVRALGHPLRNTILGLLHERAATVSELAVAIGRPKSTVAHHVKVLVDAGLLQVVRTRRVRAIEERYYGRTARMFFVAVGPGSDTEPMGVDFDDFEVAARESETAFNAGKLWGFIRHARITDAQASGFWERMAELVREFDELPRGGETVYGSPSASTRPIIRAFPRPLSEAAPESNPQGTGNEGRWDCTRTPVRRLSRTFAQANN